MRSLKWTRWEPSVHVFVGGDRRDDCVHDWLPYLTNVDICWTSESRFARDERLGAVRRRDPVRAT